LYAYFRVGDVRKASIGGFDGIAYLGNTNSNSKKWRRGDVVLSFTPDGAYVSTQNSLRLPDPVLNRYIHTAKQNSLTTVIWNPWPAGARAANILEGAVALVPGPHFLQRILLVRVS